MNDRLSIALASESSSLKEEPKVPTTQANVEGKDSKIVTSEAELDGYYIIKTLLRESIDADRISIRDGINYCSVLLDNNSRKPIARMYLNGSNKYLGLFDDKTREEGKVPIETPDDIYKYTDKLIAITQYYEAQKPQDKSGKSLVSFTFKGEKYEIKYWKDMLLKISGIMAGLHKDRFDDILTLSGRLRPFFSRNPTDLRSASQIEGTDIYAEVNLSAGSILKLSKSVIEKFGYSESDLLIESE